LTEKKKFTGITTNHCVFQGTIIADPTFNQGYGFMTLRTEVLQNDRNGQITRVEQMIPLIAEPSGPVNVVQQHVKEGREMQVWCQYKSWEVNGTVNHGFIVRKIDLGRTPFRPQTNNDPAIPA
jgi:hypothetical protein